jgi:hypothetical protein
LLLLRCLDDNLPVSSLWESIARPNESVAGIFHGRSVSIPLAELTSGSTLGGRLESLRGRCVVLATKDQLPTAVALMELDGVARRIVLCTPDLSRETLAAVAATAQADAAAG